MTNTNATDKRTAIGLLANGDATMAEIARLTGVSRQAVAKWAKAAGIDPVAARKAKLERLWQDQRDELAVLAIDQLWQLGVAVETRLVPKRKRLK